MFGKKILVSIIIIIMLVLLMSNICNALSPNPEDFNYDENFQLSVVPAPSIIMSAMIINIPNLILESINLVISLILFRKNSDKKKYVLIILINIIMIFVTIRFAFTFYSIWQIIAVINLIIQTIIVIYLIKKIKTMKKEGEESVKNRK